MRLFPDRDPVAQRDSERDSHLAAVFNDVPDGGTVYDARGNAYTVTKRPLPESFDVLAARVTLTLRDQHAPADAHPGGACDALDPEFTGPECDVDALARAHEDACRAGDPAAVRDTYRAWLAATTRRTRRLGRNRD